MKQERLEEVLKEHSKWLKTRFDSEIDGMRADLRHADLRHADLRHADLTGADLTDANLAGADLTGADLTDANLAGANLAGANLTDANLAGANLAGANLTGADLAYAKLTGADLTRADLAYANLDYSCLPLWCGSLKANFDDKQITQILYHVLSATINSNNVSEELKEKLLIEQNLEIANKFHRVNECGTLKKEESND